MARSNKLSSKQEEILTYLKDQIISRGFPPSVREICEAVNLKSTSSVHSHLESLEHKGYIKRDPAKPRCIEIVDQNFNTVRRELSNIPILGTVTAGQPILAVENIEGYFPLPAELNLSSDQCFMLHVRGTSMINAGIFNGDSIIVRRQNTADNGDYVVALIDEEVTVKTFYREKDHIRLQPENDTMDPIIVRDVTILGKVVGLFRSMK